MVRTPLGSGGLHSRCVLSATGVPGKNERLVMRLVTRESSKNEPRNKLDSLVTS